MTTDYVASDEPVMVHIVADDSKPATVSRKFRGTITRSYLAGSAENILPKSAGVRCATVIVGGAPATHDPVIFCDSQSEASNAAAQFAAAPGSMGGAIVQAGTHPFRIEHNDEVWLARLTSALAAPIVSLIIEYEA